MTNPHFIHLHPIAADPIVDSIERMKSVFREREARGDVKTATPSPSPRPKVQGPKSKKQTAQASAGPVMNRHWSEPPEADDDYRWTMEDRPGFTQAEARQFAHAPERVKEAALGSAAQVDGLERLLRSKKGTANEWAYNHDITAALGISHVNNVVSKLRAVLDDRGSGEDVDSWPITATRWVYRICLKSESRRLQKDNPSREAGH